MEKYDVIVIGSGMAGMTIANKCAKKGLRTAVTDSRPYGGTCALRGCDPKKILVGAAEIILFLTSHLLRLLDLSLTCDLNLIFLFLLTHSPLIYLQLHLQE